MRILIVDGLPLAEARLAEILASAGTACELESLSCLSPGELSPARTARALVLEDSWAEPARSIAVFDALRAEPEFDDTLLFAAVTSAQVWTLGGYLGFDDFVIPPFRRDELAGRIGAAELRRCQRRSFGFDATFRGMAVDRAAHQVSVEGRLIQLTAKEFALFSYFCENVGRVLSRRRLVAHVWGHDYAGGLRTVDVHIRRLRIKFGDALPIETLRCNGYRLRAGSAQEQEQEQEQEATLQASSLGSAGQHTARRPWSAEALRASTARAEIGAAPARM